MNEIGVRKETVCEEEEIALEDDIRIEQMECVIEQWGSWKKIKPRPMPAWGKGLVRLPISDLPDFSGVHELESRLALKKKMSAQPLTGRGRRILRSTNLANSSTMVKQYTATEVNEMIQDQCRHTFPNRETGPPNMRTLRSPKPRNDIIDGNSIKISEPQSHVMPKKENSLKITSKKILASIEKTLPVREVAFHEKAEAQLTSTTLSPATITPKHQTSMSSSSSTSKQGKNCIISSPKYKTRNWDPDYEFKQGPHTWRKDKDFPDLNMMSKKPVSMKAVKNKEQITFKTTGLSLIEQTVAMAEEPVSDNKESDSDLMADAAFIRNIVSVPSQGKQIEKHFETIRMGNIPKEISTDELSSIIEAYGAKIVKIKKKNEGKSSTALISVQDCDANLIAQYLNGENPFGAFFDGTLLECDVK